MGDEAGGWVDLRLGEDGFPGFRGAELELDGPVGRRKVGEMGMVVGSLLVVWWVSCAAGEPLARGAG